MRKAEGGVGVSQLECVNPRKDKWRLRWGVLPKEDSENIVTYMEEDFNHRPTPEEIEQAVADSGVDASDSEVEAIGQVLGYGKDEFAIMIEKARTARISSDPNAQLMEAMREQMSGRTDMEDGKALMLANMFFTFSELCKREKEIKAGTIFRYGNKLWRVVQTHTPQSVYPPSIDTASLYMRIDKSHAGTLDDPIPYEQNMAFEKGKYYSQYGVTYLCILTTVTGYPYDLKDLSTIVQAV